MANSDGADSSRRTGILQDVAGAICATSGDHPARIGVDGICAAGKSTFARALVAELIASGRPASHLDSDGFHHVRAHRYRQGRDSARGYYEDGYDFESLAEKVLRPLGPGGSLRYATKVHDLRSDAIVTDALGTAPVDAVVVFDATFIQNRQLDGLWDEVIYLDADEAVATTRGIARDAAGLGGEAAARIAYQARYMAACRIYRDERNPRERASIVIDNTDPMTPILKRLNPRRSR